MLLFFTFSIFSQTAKKIGEFAPLACDDLIMRISLFHQEELENKPQNKLYVIYYEGQKYPVTVYDDKNKKSVTTFKNPRFGDALNQAKEIPFYLKKLFKIPNQRVILIDGGFREWFSLEIWSVPEGAEIPKATPTLERKDVKFVKGKPYKTRLRCDYYE
jgi:hypothetical protein